MIRVIFRKLEKSELARSIVIERVESLIEKFNELSDSNITVTLDMDNSPLQAGPDVFKAKIFISTGKYKGVTLTKSDSNLYKAVADLVEHMLEKLNRKGDRDRVRKRTVARKLSFPFRVPAFE